MFLYRTSVYFIFRFELPPFVFYEKVGIFNHFAQISHPNWTTKHADYRAGPCGYVSACLLHRVRWIPAGWGWGRFQLFVTDTIGTTRLAIERFRAGKSSRRWLPRGSHWNNRNTNGVFKKVGVPSFPGLCATV